MHKLFAPKKYKGDVREYTKRRPKMREDFTEKVMGVLKSLKVASTGEVGRQLKVPPHLTRIAMKKLAKAGKLTKSGRGKQTRYKVV